MARLFALASCALLLLISALPVRAENSSKDKADAAMMAFQFCAAAKIATLGKSESSEFLVDAAIEACREEAEQATDAFWTYAKSEMHAPPNQHGLVSALYAKEMHTRVVQLVVAFKSND